MLDAGLLLLWYTHGDMTLAHRYMDKLYADLQKLQRAGVRRSLGSLSPRGRSKPEQDEACPASWMAAVQERWAAWSVDEEISVLMAGRTRARHLERAKGFVRGARLLNWLERQNEKALAPTGPAMSRARRMAFNEGRASQPEGLGAWSTPGRPFLKGPSQINQGRLA